MIEGLLTQIGGNSSVLKARYHNKRIPSNRFVEDRGR